MQNNEKLKEIMSKKGWTATDVALRLQVHPVTVRRWLCGMRSIDDFYWFSAEKLLTKGGKK